MECYRITFFIREGGGAPVFVAQFWRVIIRVSYFDFKTSYVVMDPSMNFSLDMPSMCWMTSESVSCFLQGINIFACTTLTQAIQTLLLTMKECQKM
jgi:hypothetical protein